MKKINILAAGVFLLALLFLSTSFLLPSNPSASLNSNCEVDLGDDVSVPLGNSVQLEGLVSCTPSDIESISWTTGGGLGSFSCTDCLDPVVEPIGNACYTITIDWADGCVSTDEICVFLQSCEAAFSDDAINSVLPEQISDEATIELEIARTQFTHIEIVDDGNVEFTIWEGWLKAGLQTVTLDFSAVPAGSHDLQVRLYPETLMTTIQKL